MKPVIDIGTFDIILVDCDHIECSVCGKFAHPNEYQHEGEFAQSRTNCTNCYMLPWTQMTELRVAKDARKKSTPYRQAKISLEKFHVKRREEVDMLYNSLYVKELIEHLTALPENSRIVVTQTSEAYKGFYCLNLHVPKFIKDVDGVNFFTIGNAYSDIL